MVHVVTLENRDQFRYELQGMHRDRKRVFVDRLKWKVPVVDGQFEVDQFDTAAAIYLLDLNPSTRAHLGSVRLLPTTAPHLLDSLFPQLCDNGVLAGDDIWEVSRLCTAPRQHHGKPREIRERLAKALVEFALIYGISRYTCIAAAGWLSQLKAMGWNYESLGSLRPVNGELIGALALHISPATLQVFRNKSGSRFPVLELGGYAKAA